MKINKCTETDKPSFCWDRDWNNAEIKRRLKHTEGSEHTLLVAWILREGTFSEVWNLLSPAEVYSTLNTLLPFLGRRKEYWRYTFDVWHKLGRV